MREGDQLIGAALRRVFAWIAFIAVLLASTSALAARGDVEPSSTEAPGDQVVDLSGEADLIGALDGGAVPSPTTPPPVKADKFEFRGFARVTMGAAVAPGATEAPGAAPQERVPYDRAFSEQHLYVDMRYSRGTWLTAVASASLALSEFYQENQASNGAPTSSVDYQAIEANVREAYIGLHSGRLDLRLGQQRIAWGNSDAFSPNDVLNGRDLRNPLVFDSEMLTLPSPAVRADVDLGLAALSLVVQPFLVSDRFDLYGTNWALVQHDTAPGYRRLFGALSQGQDRASGSALQNVLSGGQFGNVSPSNGSVGASLRTRLGGVDFSYYFLSGFDRTPAVYVDPAFQAQLESSNATEVNGAVFDALLNQARASNDAVGGPIVVSYRRRNHVGMDAQTTVGPFVLRADVAYDSAKTFFTESSLNSVVKPTIQEVVGLEYQTGSFDKLIAFEGWAMQVLDPELLYVPSAAPAAAKPLLWYRDENYAVANLIRWSFIENTIIEVRSTVGLSPFWYSVRPEVGYETSTFTVRLGFMGMGGDDGTLGSYYRRNSTAYITTRVLF